MNDDHQHIIENDALYWCNNKPLRWFIVTPFVCFIHGSTMLISGGWARLDDTDADLCTSVECVRAAHS